jgi:glutathione S-transferase
MENTYRLHYFNGNGRAANIRAMFVYSKVNFEDNRIEFPDWPSIKSSGKLENGQVPVLEVNGKQYSQSMAIELYLARLFNLMGSNIEDEYQITNLLCSREDYSKPMFEVIMPNEDQKNRREAIIKNLAGNILPNMVQKYEAKYVANGAGKYFLGNTFSLADIFLFSAYLLAFESPLMKESFGDIPAKHSPKLNELTQRLRQEELKEYFENTYVKTSNF